MASSSSRTHKKRKPEKPIVMPVYEPKILTAQEEVFSFERTASDEAKKAYNDYFSKCGVNLEHGMDFEWLGDEVRAIFEEREWMNIASERTEKINLSIVSEFYSVLSTYDKATIEELEYIPLRTTNVTFNPVIINTVYGISEFMNEDDYHTVWELDQPGNLRARSIEAQMAFDPTAKWKEGRFPYGRCMRDLRAIKQFIGHNINPSSHLCAFNREDIVLTWAIVRYIPVNLGRIIFNKACDFVKNKPRSGNMPFPHLISVLCDLLEVRPLATDRMMSPYAPLIGQNLTTLPAGTLNFRDYDPQNQQPPQQQPPQPPRTEAQPSFHPPQPLQSHNSNIEALLQHLIQAQARTDANLALSAESHRLWHEDLRQGLRGHVSAMRDIDPAYAIASESYYQFQTDPYTLPCWIPPVPPPVIFQDYTPLSVGPSGIFTGTADASAGMGGFTSVSEMTAGLGSMGLDGSVTMTTRQIHATLPASTTHVPVQYSYGLHATQSLGAEFPTSGLSGSMSEQFDSTFDVDADIDP